MNRWLAIALIPLLAVLVLPHAFAWWNTAWKYRRVIEINNATGTTLTDYQIKVILDTGSIISEGKLQPDCNDLRFIDANDITELNYWIASGCDTNHTVIWVKVPAIPPGEYNIYAYYGNPTAPSESNADKVFILYDDFSESTINPAKWTVVLPAGNVYISNGRLVLAGDGSISDRPIIRTTQPIPGNVEIFWIGQRANADGQLHMVYGWDGNSLHSLYYYPINSYHQVAGGDVVRNDNGTWVKIADINTLVDPAKEYNFIFRYWGNGNIYIWRSDANEPSSATVVDTTYPPGYIAFYGRELSGYYSYVDLVIIRKYVYPDPITTVYPEESFGFVSTTLTHTPTAQSALALDPENNVLSVSVEYNATLAEQKADIIYWEWIENGTVLEYNTTDVNNALLTREYNAIGDYNVCFFVEYNNLTTGTEGNAIACNLVYINAYPYLASAKIIAQGQEPGISSAEVYTTGELNVASWTGAPQISCTAAGASVSVSTPVAGGSAPAQGVATSPTAYTAQWEMNIPSSAAGTVRLLCEVNVPTTDGTGVLTRSYAFDFNVHATDVVFHDVVLDANLGEYNVYDTGGHVWSASSAAAVPFVLMNIAYIDYTYAPFATVEYSLNVTHYPFETNFVGTFKAKDFLDENFSAPVPTTAGTSVVVVDVHEVTKLIIRCFDEDTQQELNAFKVLVLGKVSVEENTTTGEVYIDPYTDLNQQYGEYQIIVYPLEANYPSDEYRIYYLNMDRNWMLAHGGTFYLDTYMVQTPYVVWQTIKVVNEAGTAIEGATVTVMRYIGTKLVPVAQGRTGYDGSVTIPLHNKMLYTGKVTNSSALIKISRQFVAGIGVVYISITTAGVQTAPPDVTISTIPESGLWALRTDTNSPQPLAQFCITSTTGAFQYVKYDINIMTLEGNVVYEESNTYTGYPSGFCAIITIDANEVHALFAEANSYDQYQVKLAISYLHTVVGWHTFTMTYTLVRNTAGDIFSDLGKALSNPMMRVMFVIILVLLAILMFHISGGWVIAPLTVLGGGAIALSAAGVLSPLQAGFLALASFAWAYLYVRGVVP